MFDQGKLWHEWFSFANQLHNMTFEVMPYSKITGIANVRSL